MRTGRETWIRYVDEWLGSGLSQAEFCRKAGICYNSFNTWKRRLSVEQASGALAGGTVSPVSVVEVSGLLSLPGRPIRLLFGQGLVIEIEPGFCPQTLREVLAVVRDGC